MNQDITPTTKLSSNNFSYIIGCAKRQYDAEKDFPICSPKEQRNYLNLREREFHGNKFMLFVTGTLQEPVFYKSEKGNRSDFVTPTQFLEIQNKFANENKGNLALYAKIRELEDEIRVLKGTIEENQKTIWEDINNYLGDKILSREQRKVLKEFSKNGDV